MSKLDELYDRVCEKLEREAEKAPQMVPVVPYLRERAAGNADNCMALLDEKKTLAGAYEAMEKAAQGQWEKKREQRGVGFDQYAACVIIDGYYGLVDEPAAAPAEEKKAPAGNVVNLFDLI